jgi:hypothetical protein
MTRDQIQSELRNIFSRHLGISSATTKGLVPQTLPTGKLYEAYVLGRVVEQLATREGYSLYLVGGTKIQLKTSGGPINRNYPRIELRRYGACVAELWTDIQFLSLSYCNASPRTITKGDFHELDILIVDAGANGYPRFDQVWLGLNAKTRDIKRGCSGRYLASGANSVS